MKVLNMFLYVRMVMVSESYIWLEWKVLSL